MLRWQYRWSFEYQARLSVELGKPLVIHLVKAMSELLKLKQQIKPANPWIIHGFRGKPALAEECLRHGFYLSFGEKYQDNDKAYDTNMYTRPEIERILKVGFEYAMKRKKHLTVVDKANVLASSRFVAPDRTRDGPFLSGGSDRLYVCR